MSPHCNKVIKKKENLLIIPMQIARLNIFPERKQWAVAFCF